MGYTKETAQVELLPQGLSYVAGGNQFKKNPSKSVACVLTWNQMRVLDAGFFPYFSMISSCSAIVLHGLRWNRHPMASCGIP